MKQPDLYYFEAIKIEVRNLVKIHKDVARNLHTKFNQACNVIFMDSKLYRSGCFIE